MPRNSAQPISAFCPDLPGNKVGVGLRHPHHQFVLDNLPPISWFEIHGENFFAAGGPSANFLSKIRQHYPLSIHCVGTSLGSAQKLHKKHLQQIKELIQRTEPFLISDHISWSNIDDVVANDLLPIPYTKEALKALCANINQMQDFLQRQILVENPSTYLSFKSADFSEDEFINLVAKKTGCGILLDVNNIYVSSQNNGFDAKKYLQNIDEKIVGEIHLAGHTIAKIGQEKILIDTHNDVVCQAVWDLYKIAVQRFGFAPTLIEWDEDLPAFEVLFNEAKKAEKIHQQMMKKISEKISGNSHGEIKMSKKINRAKR